jgi:hypothetical protein
MSVLQEISGALAFLPSTEEAPAPQRRQEGISGLEWHIPASQLKSHYRKSPQSEGVLALSKSRRLFFEIQEGLSAELEQVRKKYVFPANHSVEAFLQDHRSVPQILMDAEPHLQDCFGADSVINLEVLIDESASSSLYAVVLWPGAVNGAESALAKFDDTWWLDNSHEASGLLTFTYELV